MRTIAGIAELRGLVGQQLGTSPYLEVSQQRINLFAQATEDYQWIHTDVARAGQESPFGATIAHGFLTLSLLSVLLERTFTVQGIRMGLNYGLNKVRFIAPVPAGSLLRLTCKLIGIEDVAGGARALTENTFELQGGARPACVAESIVVFYV